MLRRDATGLWIVAATVILAAILASFVKPPQARRAAADVSGVAAVLPRFELNGRGGARITNDELADDVWVAGFVFTRCPSSCPRISSLMKRAQADLAGSGVRLVSISVDPEHDTPPVMERYLESFEAEPGRWDFLTGSQDAIYSLVRKGFMLAVEPVPGVSQKTELVDISHSNKLALVDRGNQLVGYYAVEDPAEYAALVARARSIDRAWVRLLPAVNASLNSVATVLLVLALVAILKRKVHTHRWLMMAALGVSALFLGTYLLYHALIGGGTSYQGTGVLRWLYFTILISHVVLAAAVVPLVLITLIRALRGRFHAHAAVARVTYPVWLYVSVTGVLVYLLLYQIPVV